MTIAKMVRLGRKGQMVLPKEVRDFLGLKEGDRLIVTVEGGHVILSAPERYATDTKGILRGTWGQNEEEIKGYLEGERGSWEGGKG